MRYRGVRCLRFITAHNDAQLIHANLTHPVYRLRQSNRRRLTSLGRDYLPAYSCKTRYFCPSCHQKRMLAYAEWLEDNVLAPVPHRQSTTRATNPTRSDISVRRSANGPVFNPRAARAEAASAAAQRCYRISYP
jgi:hypothetical protein